MADVTVNAQLDAACEKFRKILEKQLVRVEDMKSHLLNEIEFRGEDVGIKFVRKFYPYYVNGFSGASKYRGELVLMDNLKDILETLDKISLQSTKKMLI